MKISVSRLRFYLKTKAGESAYCASSKAKQKALVEIKSYEVKRLFILKLVGTFVNIIFLYLPFYVIK